jgi:hypothetical protein
MSEEVQLATKQTALVDGATSTKMGKAIVTSERIVFVDTKFMGVAGGALGAAIRTFLFNDGWKELSPVLKEALQTRHGRQVVEQSPDSWRVG